MKRTGIWVIAASALLFAGCGSAASIDAEALAKTLATSITYDDTLQEVDDDTISMYIDLPDGVTAVMYMGSGSTAEEVAVFTAPDEETAKETKESVEAHLQEQTEAYEDYLPEEVKRIGNAVVDQRDQYVVLCVSGDSDQAEALIDEAFE